VETALGTSALGIGSSPMTDLLLVILDRTIQIVDPATNRVLLEFPMSDVRDFSFSPDGTKLALTSGGYYVSVLDLDINRWMRELCAVANRDLSAAEWTRLAGTDIPMPSSVCTNSAGGG